MKLEFTAKDSDTSSLSEHFFWAWLAHCLHPRVVFKRKNRGFGVKGSIEYRQLKTWVDWDAARGAAWGVSDVLASLPDEDKEILKKAMK